MSATSSSNVTSLYPTEYPVKWIAASAACFVVAVAIAALGGSKLFGSTLNPTRITLITGAGVFAIIHVGTATIVISRKKQLEREEKFVRHLTSNGITFDGAASFLANYPLSNLANVVKKSPELAAKSIWLLSLCNREIQEGLKPLSFIKLLAEANSQEAISKLFKFLNASSAGLQRDLCGEICSDFFKAQHSLAEEKYLSLAKLIATSLYEEEHKSYQEFIGTVLLNSTGAKALEFMQFLYAKEPARLPHALIFEWKVAEDLTVSNPSLLHLCNNTPETIQFILNKWPLLTNMEASVTSQGNETQETPLTFYRRIYKEKANPQIERLLTPNQISIV